VTIRISLRVVAFVVYTLALLGGAFGISYAVFEWRDDGGPSDCDIVKQTFWQGIVTPGVDPEALQIIIKYLEENCE